MANENQKSRKTMNELVQRLLNGEHRIEVSLRTDKTAIAFKECIDRGYVHIKFIDTKGGTDLGVRLDSALSNFQEADFDRQTGQVHLVGNLTLNYVKVRCVADIEIETLEGKGHLENL